MNICGKGNFPECQFFTTGGCVSPFNCIHKIKQDFNTRATSNAMEIGRNAEIDYVADSKTEQTITDLLIEFDEMGFVPTTVCPNHEQYATEWRERVRKEFDRLTAENKRLREEAAEQKSIAEHEHATQMEWFSIACDYVAELVALKNRLEAELKGRMDKMATKVEADRNAWEKACELACEELQFYDYGNETKEDGIKMKLDYFYQQAKKELREERKDD